MDFNIVFSLLLHCSKNFKETTELLLLHVTSFVNIGIEDFNDTFTRYRMNL